MPEYSLSTEPQRHNNKSACRAGLIPEKLNDREDLSPVSCEKEYLIVRHVEVGRNVNNLAWNLIYASRKSSKKLQFRPVASSRCIFSCSLFSSSFISAVDTEWYIYSANGNIAA